MLSPKATSEFVAPQQQASVTSKGQRDIPGLGSCLTKGLLMSKGYVELSPTLTEAL